MRYRSLTASAILALSASQAWGQAAEPFHLGTIFIGSDATSADDEIGLDNEDLTRINPTDLQDVFAGEPSISVGSSMPVSQKIYVQGVEENQLHVTIDGARQNNRIFHHSATTYIDPELLKAVRVDPGVAPADAGPGAMAGAIAFETKDVDDLLSEGRSFGGRFSTEYQSNGNGLHTSLGLYGRSGGLEFLAFGKIGKGDVRKDGNGDEILGSSTDLGSVLGKLAYNMADGSRVELSYEKVEDDAMRPFRADFASLGGRVATRRYALKRQNVVLTYEGAATSDMWSPFVQLAANSTQLDVGRSRFGLYGGEAKSFTGVFKNEFSLTNGTVTAGFDFYNDSVDIQEVGGGAFFAEEKARNVGVFAQARLEFADKLRVSAGARYDIQKFTGLDGSTHRSSGLSANLALDYALNDVLTISAGASRVWGGIALAESFVMDAGWTYPTDIKPTTSENFYLGARADWGVFSADAKIYRTDIANARTPGRAGPTATSDLKVNGFELGMQYNWDSGFLRVGYAHSDSTINGVQADSYSGRYLTTPLGKQIALELGHSIEEKGLRMGVNAQIALERKETYNFGSPAAPLPTYKVVNAFVEYKPRQVENLTIRGEINNIFDEQYADHASYGQEFTGPAEMLVPNYEPGRSFGLSLNYTF